MTARVAPRPAPTCARCRERLDHLTREAAALPLAPGTLAAPFPDREKFDPLIGAWLFVGAAEREALIEHVLLFVHRSAAPPRAAAQRPALRVIRGGRVARRARGGAR